MSRQHQGEESIELVPLPGGYEVRWHDGAGGIMPLWHGDSLNEACSRAAEHGRDFGSLPVWRAIH